MLDDAEESLEKVRKELFPESQTKRLREIRDELF